MDIQKLFKLGMKRDLPQLISYDDGLVADIGSSGKFKVPGAVSIGLPEWRFPEMPLPFEDGSVTTVHAYHFFEHLPGEHVVLLLKELERVMVPGRSVCNFSVPYFSSSLAVQDLSHKSFWCEDNFKNLFDDQSYDKGQHAFKDVTYRDDEWKMKVHFLMIAGIVARNLAVIGQLVRVK